MNNCHICHTSLWEGARNPCYECFRKELNKVLNSDKVAAIEEISKKYQDVE